MEDPKGIEKPVVTFKVAIRIPRQTSFAVSVIYVDSQRFNFLGMFSLVAIGQESPFELIVKPHSDLLSLIESGPNRFEINSDLQYKLDAGLTKSLTQEAIKTLTGFINQKDFGSAENLIKRLAEGALAIDKTMVRLECERLSYGEYLEVRAEEEILKMTFAKKMERVMPYANNNRDVAEKILRENPKDCAVVKFRFHRDAELFGSGMLIYSTMGNIPAGVYLCAGRAADFAEGDITAAVVDFYTHVTELASSAAGDRAMTAKIESALCTMRTDQLAGVVDNNNADALNALIKKEIADAAGGNVECALSISMINSLRLSLLISPRKKTRHEMEPGAGKDEFSGVQIINADLILAPTRGKNISSLKAGDHVQAMLDPSSPLAMKILRGLNLVVGSRVKPIGATVYSIKYQQKAGYKIYLKIADGILGKAEEEQDVRIKMGDPVVEETLDQAKNSMVIGIIAGILVLAAIIVIVWLL